jgi:hypothetical protein
MSALPKATHFDIADAWRAVPESHGRITRSCDGAAMTGKRRILRRATTKGKGSKRFRDRDIEATNGDGPLPPR